MSRARPGAAFVLMLLTFSSGAAAERFVTVTTPDGAFDATARVGCVDPLSEEVAVDSTKRAAIRADCRRVRCVSERWRSRVAVVGASGVATCALMPAVTLAFELPQRAGGDLVVSVRSPGASKPLFETTSTAVDTGLRPQVVSPPLPPAVLDISVARLDGSWVCRASSTPFMIPEPTRVIVPWRDAVVVEGRIASPEGHPRPDVPVVAISDARPETDLWAQPMRGQLEPWRCRAPDADRRSDSDGKFRLAIDPQIESLVVAGGWGDPRGIAFAVRSGPHPEPLHMVPEIPHRVVARVLDEDDRPVPCRARVAIAKLDERWAQNVLPGGPKEAVCASDGRLDVGPFRSDTFDLDVRSAEALPLRVSGRAASGTAVNDLGVIRVDRGIAMRIAVTDADRAPVEGAAATVVSRGGFVIERKGRTGADGVAQIAGLPRGTRVEVGVEAAGYRKASRTGIPPEGALTVELDRAEPVRGVVTSSDGTPVRARVDATRPDGSLLAQAEADESGSFSFLSLPGGDVRLQAIGRGYRPSPLVALTLEADRAPQPVSLTLGELERLRGTVLDPSRSPLAGVDVLLVPSGILLDPPGSSALAATRSAHDGRFTLDATGSSDETIVAIAAGFAPAARRVATLPDRSSVELIVGPGARLSVRVPRSLSDDAALVVSDGSGTRHIVPVRSRPEVLVEDLVAGDGWVSLRNGRARPIRLVAGETASVDLSAGGMVRGHVTSQGHPQARAAVVLAMTGDGGISTSAGALTGADGSFALGPVASGECLLVAVAGDARAEKRIVVPQDGDIEANLDLVARSLRVIVRERGGAGAVVGAAVRVAPPGAVCSNFAEAGAIQDGVGWQVAVSHSGCARSTSGDDGAALLMLGASGSYVLSVEAAGFIAWNGPIDIVDGVTDALVELTRGGPPSVRVLIETDPPGISGAIYCVQQGHGSSRAPVAGEAVCENFERGRAEIAFRAPGFGMARVAVDVPESGEILVPLRVERGGTLIVPLGGSGATRIRVIDPRGVVWNGPYGQGWPLCELETAQAVGGAYVCHEIPPGNYTAEVDGTRRSSVEVRPGESTVAY